MKRACIFLVVLALFLAVPWPLSANRELLQAFEKGDTAAILRMLDADATLLTADLGSGMTVLHYAAYTGDAAVFDHALRKGASLHAKDGRNLTPVWFTVSGNRPAMLRKLIALGADLGVTNAEGDSLLFRAISARNPDTVRILLDNGFQVSQKNRYGMSPIDYAANANSVAILELLVSRGAVLAKSTGPELSLLHRASLSGGAEVVHYLLDRGFDINQKDQGGRTPLLLAIDVGNRDAARALVLRGADVNAASPDAGAPLQLAVKKGVSDLVDLLAARGVDFNVVDPRTGKTMLHEAALRGRPAVVEKLLAAGVRKDARDKNGYTALSYALKYGNRTTADLLRQAGVPEVPWETNLDDSRYLRQPLGQGEAHVWYLRHSGWAVKTKSALLVFDYWDNDAPPSEKLLANGHIAPEALSGLPVYVFSTHDHGDHFDRQILEWRKVLPSITYVFGFAPPGVDGIIAMEPRAQRTIGPLTVTTIRANDAGVGFAVQVDGLTVFHAGDHSNNAMAMEGNDFFPEIDFLASKGIRPDVSFFLNAYGCGSTNPEAFQKGIFYAVDKLKIKAVLPMHAADKEWVYAELVEGVARQRVNVAVGAATNSGDRFHVVNGTLAKQP